MEHPILSALQTFKKLAPSLEKICGWNPQMNPYNGKITYCTHVVLNGKNVLVYLNTVVFELFLNHIFIHLCCLKKKKNCCLPSFLNKETCDMFFAVIWCSLTWKSDIKQTAVWRTFPWFAAVRVHITLKRLNKSSKFQAHAFDLSTINNGHDFSERGTQC